MNTVTNYLKNASLIFVFAFIINNAFATSNPTDATEELTSFEIVSSTETVEIIWQFTKDIEGEVQVQRSGMDMNFETIGEIDGTAANRFADNQPQSGFTFYRLAIKNTDGTVTYQKVAALSR
ncbi:MAG: hypothetical protein AAF944_21735 [Bacteroidota bacterium]